MKNECDNDKDGILSPGIGGPAQINSLLRSREIHHPPQPKTEYRSHEHLQSTIQAHRTTTCFISFRMLPYLLDHNSTYSSASKPTKIWTLQFEPHECKSGYNTISKSIGIKRPTICDKSIIGLVHFRPQKLSEQVISNGQKCLHQTQTPIPALQMPWRCPPPQLRELSNLTIFISITVSSGSQIRQAYATEWTAPWYRGSGFRDL